MEGSATWAAAAGCARWTEHRRRKLAYHRRMHRIAPEDRCLTLVIAAYNEADALPALQPRIAAALDAAEREGLQARVLYIDDGSRDATWSILHGLAAKDPRIGLPR